MEGCYDYSLLYSSYSNRMESFGTELIMNLEMERRRGGEMINIDHFGPVQT